MSKQNSMSHMFINQMISAIYNHIMQFKNFELQQNVITKERDNTHKF